MKTENTQTASDGRNGFLHGVPSADTKRIWRAKNCDVTYRVFENKWFTKVQAECYAHVKTFVGVYLRNNPEFLRMAIDSGIWVRLQWAQSTTRKWKCSFHQVLNRVVQLSIWEESAAIILQQSLQYHRQTVAHHLFLLCVENRSCQGGFRSYRKNMLAANHTSAVVDARNVVSARWSCIGIREWQYGNAIDYVDHTTQQ